MQISVHIINIFAESCYVSILGYTSYGIREDGGSIIDASKRRHLDSALKKHKASNSAEQTNQHLVKGGCQKPFLWNPSVM